MISYEHWEALKFIISLPFPIKCALIHNGSSFLCLSYYEVNLKVESGILSVGRDRKQSGCHKKLLPLSWDKQCWDKAALRNKGQTSGEPIGRMGGPRGLIEWLSQSPSVPHYSLPIPDLPSHHRGERSVLTRCLVFFVCLFVCFGPFYPFYIWCFVFLKFQYVFPSLNAWKGTMFLSLGTHRTDTRIPLTMVANGRTKIHGNC